MENLRMDPKLAEAIEKARHHKMTPLEHYEQRVSWIYGEVNMNRSDDQIITKEQIEKILLEQHGIAKPIE